MRLCIYIAHIYAYMYTLYMKIGRNGILRHLVHDDGVIPISTHEHGQKSLSYGLPVSTVSLSDPPYPAPSLSTTLHMNEIIPHCTENEETSLPENPPNVLNLPLQGEHPFFAGNS